MKIPEFVNQIAAAFDSKLKTQSQIDAFETNCKNHLKKYEEGGVLEFAFNEIIYSNQSRTHPTVGKIIKICNSKMGTDHKVANPISKEHAQWLVNKKLAKEFESTDAFEWAARRMIGWDVLLHIEKHGAKPTNVDVDRFLKAHEEFPKTMQMWRDHLDGAEFIKMGNALEQRNLEYYEKYR